MALEMKRDATNQLEGRQLYEGDVPSWELTWTEELRRRLANDDGRRFYLGRALAELRASSSTTR
jgi:hypothetical protein